MENRIHWYPGHMAKTRRLIQDNLKMIDVVIEIIDARIPLSGKNTDFDDILKKKPRLLVLNKADLADPNATNAWISTYARKGVKVMPVSCTTGAGINKVFNEAKKLVQDKIDSDAAKGRTRTLKLMMAGIPNVGKSSLINRLVGKASTKTGDKAGVSKGKQWVRVRGDVELLDIPGMLPHKLEDQERAKYLVYTGALKDEIMNTELLAYDLCSHLRDTYPELLCTRYKLDTIDGLEGYEILEKIGRKRGFIISGGEIDMERAANILFDEFRGAKIGRITLEKPNF